MNKKFQNSPNQLVLIGTGLVGGCMARGGCAARGGATAPEDPAGMEITATR